MDFDVETIDVDGHRAHVWSGGSGYPLLLMHGAGPGTSAAGNFAKVREPLAERYRVYGTDIIGFGKSDTKTTPPYFDYELWYRQMQSVLDTIPDGPVGLIGHSISSTFALRLASANKRVDRILLTCPMGTALEPNEYLQTLWSFPYDEHSLRKSLKVLIRDESLITDELVSSRLAVLNQPGYAEYFEKIFGGDKRNLIRPTIVSSEELAAVDCPVSVIHGRDDLAFPYEETTAVLSQNLPQADIHLLSNCSHGPAFERPEEFLAIAFNFFGEV